MQFDTILTKVHPQHRSGLLVRASFIILVTSHKSWRLQKILLTSTCCKCPICWISFRGSRNTWSQKAGRIMYFINHIRMENCLVRAPIEDKNLCRRANWSSYVCELTIRLVSFESMLLSCWLFSCNMSDIFQMSIFKLKQKSDFTIWQFVKELKKFQNRNL